MTNVARARDITTYSKLVEQITVVTYTPNGKPLADLLCDISRASYKTCQIMLYSQRFLLGCRATKD